MHRSARILRAQPPKRSKQGVARHGGPSLQSQKNTCRSSGQEPTRKHFPACHKGRRHWAAFTHCMGSVAAVVRVPSDLGDHPVVGLRVPAACCIFPFRFGREPSPHPCAILFCVCPAHSTHRKSAITGGRVPGRLGCIPPISCDCHFSLAQPEALLDGHLVRGFFVVLTFAVLRRASHHECSGRNPNVVQSVRGIQPGLQG